MASYLRNQTAQIFKLNQRTRCLATQSTFSLKATGQKSLKHFKLFQTATGFAQNQLFLKQEMYVLKQW